MFPLTHLYFAEKVWKLVPDLPYNRSLLALGSTFPDVVVAGFLNHAQTHQGAGRMVNFFKAHAPELLPFALGALTHGSQPGGLDYYGDERYQDFERGYCFEKARPIIADVIKYCRLPEEYGWWKAHNFIEMAIEVELGERHPELQRQLYDAYHDSETIRQVSTVLGDYFGKPEQEIFQSITFFTRFIALESITAADLAEKYRLQIKTKHNICVDTAGVEATIQRARYLVRGDFGQFEQYVVERLVELITAYSGGRT